MQSTLDGVCEALPESRIRVRNLDDGRALPMRCKRWACRDCGPWLKRRLRRAIHCAADRHDLRRFVTLTLTGEWHPTRLVGGRRVPNPGWNGRSEADAYRFMSECWVKFQKKVERHRGYKLKYGAVREAHGDGTPHVHGLIDNYLPFAKLQQWWNEVGGGMANIKLVDAQRVAAYLSKYMSKDGRPPPKGFRKYATGGGVRFENVRPPRPPPVPRHRPAAAVAEWMVETVNADGSWSAPFDPGPAIGNLAKAPDIARRAWKARPTPPAPRCACGERARDCYACEGPHCKACRGGSSTCWGNR